jgi:hypothetical protein
MLKIPGFLLVVILSLQGISLSCNDTSDCKKIKDGKFYYYTKKTRERIDVERFDSLQLETDAKTANSPLKSKIVWKDDCSYDMYINAFTETRFTGDDSIFAATPSQVSIIYIGDTFYVCIAKMDVFDKHMEFRDTLFFSR